MRLRCGSSRGRAARPEARRTAVPALAAAATALLPAAPARAQHVEYKAAITLTGAFTQSITDAPYPTAQTFAGPSIALSPSLVALLDTLRTENTLTYSLSLSVPFAIHANPGVNTYALTYANRLTYAGHYALSELTTMTLGAGFTESPINTFIPSQDPTEAPIQATPEGAAVMLTTNANEGFARQITERTSFTQTGSFTYAYPMDPVSVRTSTYSATNAFGFTRAFTRDTAGITLTNQLNYFTASQASVTSYVLPSRFGWVNTLAVDYNHPFTEAFSGSIIAGATQTLNPGAANFMLVQPSGSLSLNYAFLLATAGLSYAHQAMPNVMTGTVNFTDTVSLRFAMPIGVTGLTANGTAGYTRSTPVGAPLVACPATQPLCNTSAILTNPSNIFLADAGLDYHPERVPTLTLGLRGQVTRQVVTDDTTALNDFTRYTIALNVTYSYPNANAAATRPQLTPLFSTQAPPSADIVSSDRLFSAPVADPAPAEPPPLPKGP